MGVIGPEMDLTYPHHHLGDGPDCLAALAKGGDAFADVLKMAEKPMLIVGMGALTRPDGTQVLAHARAVAEATGMVSDAWNGFNVLHTAASRVGGSISASCRGRGDAIR